MSAWSNPWFRVKAKELAKARERDLSRLEAERTRAAHEAERIERNERHAAQTKLQIEWGNEYPTAMRLLGKAVKRMPFGQRHALESEFTADGRRRGNDPDTIRAVVQRERAAPEWFGAEVQKHGSERKAYEALMRDRSSPYYRGPDRDRLQAHYRDVLREEQRGENNEGAKP